MSVDSKLLSHYHLIADLFDYPDQEYPEKVRRIKTLLDGSYPKATGELEKFLNLLPVDSVVTMQALFSRTFDVQAITTLDIGYVLFGDDYKRGELLANLNREHADVDNDCGSELSDHLPNLLRLIALSKDKPMIEELVEEILAPALRSMHKEFVPDRIEKKNKSYRKHYKTLIEMPVAQLEINTLYQWAVNTLYKVIEQDFEIIESTPLVHGSDFLQSLNRENEIEEAAGTT
jgi:nitrate reductase assembly molybdenum cofactor insertion protein NarJ